MSDKECAAALHRTVNGKVMQTQNCTQAREPGKLFCARHIHASNRILLERTTISNEMLDTIAWRELNKDIW